MNIEDSYMSTTEAAKSLGYSHHSYINKLCKRGVLECVEIAGVKLVSKASVEDYKRNRKPAGRPKEG